MKLFRYCILPAAILVSLSACTVKSADQADPSSSGASADLDQNQNLLVADNDEASEAEEGLEQGIEDGLSGAIASDPGTPADGDADSVDAKIKTNPGLFFRPAGCITSTREDIGKWTHELKDCTGPGGRVTYNGTVHSTYTLEGGKLTALHEATDFEAAGKNVTVVVSGSRTVDYTLAGGIVTKHRVGTWEGTITKNSDPSKTGPFTHNADFTSTWDREARCITHDGSATDSVAGREFGRSITGYKRCGIGRWGCPESGTIELNRKDGDLKLTIDFLGGRDVKITLPNGKSGNIKLFCAE